MKGSSKMPISHIEREIIPEKTITTVVLNIPASEMRTFRLKSVLYPAAYITLFFGGFVGLFVGCFAAGIYFDINVSSTEGIIRVVLIAIAITLPFVWLLNRIHEAGYTLTEKLLRKHGWDGKARYRIESIEEVETEASVS